MSDHLQALLLIEDRKIKSPLSKILRELDFNLKNSSSAKNFVEIIKKETVHIAVLEHSSGIDPETILTHVLSKSPTTQLILLSNRIAPQQALNWINAGGFACFKTPVERDLFIRKLKPFCSILKNQLFLLETHRSLGQKLREETQNLAQKAHYDGLTRLLNKKFFETRGESLLNEVRTRRQTLSLIILDIDYFKIYNDSHGHLQGDRALKKLARILEEETRQSDLPGRVGGEEFAILLPGSDAHSTHKLAERLRKNVENTKFAGEESQPGGRLTISLGHSTFPDHGESFRRLFELADRATYQSKRLKRNRTTGTVLQEFQLKEKKPGQFQSVSVVGDFNSWTPESEPLSRAGKSIWKKELPVPTGPLRYGFLIDHKKIIADPANRKKTSDSEGNQISIIEAG